MVIYYDVIRLIARIYYIILLSSETKSNFISEENFPTNGTHADVSSWGLVLNAALHSGNYSALLYTLQSLYTLKPTSLVDK